MTEPQIYSQREIAFAEALFTTLCRSNNVQSLSVQHIKKYSQGLELKQGQLSNILSIYFPNVQVFDVQALSKFIRCVSATQNNMDIEQALKQQNFSLNLKIRQQMESVPPTKQNGRVCQISLPQEYQFDQQFQQILQMSEKTAAQLQLLHSEDVTLPIVMSREDNNKIKKQLQQLQTQFKSDLGQLELALQQNSGDSVAQLQAINAYMVEQQNDLNHLLQVIQETVQLETELAKQTKAVECQKQENERLKSMLQQNEDILSKNQELLKELNVSEQTAQVVERYFRECQLQADQFAQQQAISNAAKQEAEDKRVQFTTNQATVQGANNALKPITGQMENQSQQDEFWNDANQTNDGLEDQQITEEIEDTEEQ